MLPKPRVTSLLNQAAWSLSLSDLLLSLFCFFFFSNLQIYNVTGNNSICLPRNNMSRIHQYRMLCARTFFGGFIYYLDGLRANVSKLLSRVLAFSGGRRRDRHLANQRRYIKKRNSCRTKGANGVFRMKR